MGLEQCSGEREIEVSTEEERKIMATPKCHSEVHVNDEIECHN